MLLTEFQHIDSSKALHLTHTINSIEEIRLVKGNISDEGFKVLADGINQKNHPVNAIVCFFKINISKKQKLISVIQSCNLC